VGRATKLLQRKPRGILIFFGDASVHAPRGHTTAPSQRILEALARHPLIRVVVTAEHWTSQRCLLRDASAVEGKRTLFPIRHGWTLDPERRSSRWRPQGGVPATRVRRGVVLHQVTDGVLPEDTRLEGIKCSHEWVRGLVSLDGPARKPRVTFWNRDSPAALNILLKGFSLMALGLIPDSMRVERDVELGRGGDGASGGSGGGGGGGRGRGRGRGGRGRGGGGGGGGRGRGAGDDSGGRGRGASSGAGAAGSRKRAALGSGSLAEPHSPRSRSVSPTSPQSPPQSPAKKPRHDARQHARKEQGNEGTDE
jgi:hypothetical protein